MSAAERGISDSAVTVDPGDPIAQTPEQYNDYLRLREKYDKEGMIREIAEKILANLCRHEDLNLSAGACAKWSVMAAVALIKYSKEAADDEKFWTDEDENGEQTFDYLFDPDEDDEDC